MQREPFDNVASVRLPSRRSMVAATAFAVPAIAMTVATPAFAQTGARQISMTATPVPGSAASSTGGVSAAAIGFEWNVVVTVTDSAGSPLAGQSVTLSGGNGVSFGLANGTTNGSGQYATVASVSLSGSGTVTITATSPGGQGAVSTSTALSYSPRAVVVSLSPSTVTAGASSTVTARVTSSSGAVLSGEAVAFSGSNLSFDQASGSTNSSGEFSTAVKATGNGGTTATVTALSSGAGGTASGSAVLTVRSRDISVSCTPSVVQSGGSSSVIVQLRNAAGIGLIGESVALTASNGVTLYSATGTTDSAGQFRTTAVAPSSAGSSVITATSTGAGGTVSATANLDFAAVLSVTVSPTSAGTSAVGQATVVATYRSNGAPVPGRPVSLSVSPNMSAVSITSSDTVTTDAAGKATFTIFHQFISFLGGPYVFTLTAAVDGYTASTTFTKKN